MDTSKFPDMPQGRFVVTAVGAAVLLVGAFSVRAWHANDTDASYEREHTLASGEGTDIPDTTGPDMPSWQSAALADMSNATGTPDDIALARAGDTIADGLAGSYLALQQTDTYTPETIQAVTKNAAADMVLVPSYTRYSANMITVATDTSYARMLSYRSDMRIALEPLLENHVAEFELYAQYVNTKDAAYLTALATAAKRYRIAANAAAHVTVPADAASAHIAVLNSLIQFATILDDFSRHGSDPVASIVLLRTYAAAEKDVFDAFNVLAQYYANKKQV